MEKVGSSSFSGRDDAVMRDDFSEAIKRLLVQRGQYLSASAVPARPTVAPPRIASLPSAQLPDGQRPECRLQVFQ